MQSFEIANSNSIGRFTNLMKESHRVEMKKH